MIICRLNKVIITHKPVSQNPGLATYFSLRRYVHTHTQNSYLQEIIQLILFAPIRSPQKLASSLTFRLTNTSAIVTFEAAGSDLSWSQPLFGEAPVDSRPAATNWKTPDEWPQSIATNAYLTSTIPIRANNMPRLLWIYNDRLAFLWDQVLLWDDLLSLSSAYSTGAIMHLPRLPPTRLSHSTTTKEGSKVRLLSRFLRFNRRGDPRRLSLVDLWVLLTHHSFIVLERRNADVIL